MWALQDYCQYSRCASSWFNLKIKWFKSSVGLLTCLIVWQHVLPHQISCSAMCHDAIKQGVKISQFNETISVNKEKLADIFIAYASLKPVLGIFFGIKLVVKFFAACWSLFRGLDLSHIIYRWVFQKHFRGKEHSLSACRFLAGWMIGVSHAYGVYLMCVSGVEPGTSLEEVQYSCAGCCNH